MASAPRRRVLVTVIEDYRIRLNGEPLPGDYAPMKDGSRGVVTAVRRTPTGYALCVAPECTVDREKYLRDG